MDFATGGNTAPEKLRGDFVMKTRFMLEKHAGEARETSWSLNSPSVQASYGVSNPPDISNEDRISCTLRSFPINRRLYTRRPSSIHKARAGRMPLNQAPDQALSMAMLFAAIHKIASTISRARNARQRNVSRSNCADSRASKALHFSRDSGLTGRAKTSYLVVGSENCVDVFEHRCVSRRPVRSVGVS
jgi:hypothetical protein